MSSCKVFRSTVIAQPGSGYCDLYLPLMQPGRTDRCHVWRKSPASGSVGFRPIALSFPFLQVLGSRSYAPGSKTFSIFRTLVAFTSRMENTAMNHSRQRNGHLPGNLAVTGQGRTVLPPLKHGCIGLRPRFCLAAAAVLTSLVAPSVGAAGELRVLHEQQILELTPANPVRAVAIDADTLVLGAPDDAERGKGTGAVYVFERPPGGTWV